MVDQETMAALAEALQKIAEAVQQSCEQLSKALSDMVTPFAEDLRQILEDIQTGVVYTPPQKLPTPPKYAGPQNKGRSWTRRPPRLARSDCRKMRR